jgi:hypothetical protein
MQWLKLVITTEDQTKTQTVYSYLHFRRNSASVNINVQNIWLELLVSFKPKQSTAK